jgi:ABC-2 type transport system ATP-binding protein
MNTTPPAIQTDHLTRTFGSVRALDALSIEVPRGTVFGFLGRNGAGKTTAIRLLLGLLDPTEGQASVLGYDIRTQASAIRAHTGALLEHDGLYERLSAADNLEFFGRIARMAAAERQTRSQELLTHFGLWERRADPVKDFSTGMRQKLAVARALLHRPPLIFLDEPTSGLDPVASASLRDDLAALVQHEGVTVFLNTHNLNEAEKLCHRVGIIRDGTLLALGSPQELRAQHGRPRLEIVGREFNAHAVAALRQHPAVAGLEQANSHIALDLRSGSEDSAALVSLAVREGVQVEEVRRERASLEEAFLALMQAEEPSDDA